jgi:DNA-nicking Smr family endonuclease
MRKGRGLTPEEAALWRRVKACVTPLRPQPPEPPADPAEAVAPPAPAPKPRKPHTHPPGPKSYVPPSIPAPPANRAPEKRVRRGQVEVVAALDLHGFNQDQARAALLSFLHAQKGPAACVVLVVTGKGGRLVAGKATAGVLKKRFPDWLAEPAVRSIIAGFAPAHARHGGGGAFYVFLKRRGE